MGLVERRLRQLAGGAGVCCASACAVALAVCRRGRGVSGCRSARSERGGRFNKWANGGRLRRFRAGGLRRAVTCCVRGCGRLGRGWWGPWSGGVGWVESCVTGGVRVAAATVTSPHVLGGALRTASGLRVLGLCACASSPGFWPRVTPAWRAAMAVLPWCGRRPCRAARRRPPRCRPARAGAGRRPRRLPVSAGRGSRPRRMGTRRRRAGPGALRCPGRPGEGRVGPGADDTGPGRFVRGRIGHDVKVSALGMTATTPRRAWADV